MPATIEHFNVVLEGRMPVIQQELLQVPSGSRTLRTKDGNVAIMYHGVHEKHPVYSGHSGTPVYGRPGNVVMIMTFASPATGEAFFARKLEEAAAPGTHVLAFTTAEMFNQPRLQNFVQSMGRATRFGVVVDEEPAKMTLSKLEASLKQWLPVWHAEADAEKDGHPSYLTLRQRLSDEATGRLDGARIAKLFGLSTAEMGAVCGVSKQSIHANPTSKGIQEKLEPMAKAARGVLWCGGDESKFKTWLNQPNPDFPEYQGKQLAPLDLIRMGHAQVIADKVQNLLTGHPS